MKYMIFVFLTYLKDSYFKDILRVKIFIIKENNNYYLIKIKKYYF